MSALYGTWRSPISAAMVAAQGLRLGAVMLDGDDVYWLEGRPGEGGRTVLVRRTAVGEVHDVTPPPLNVRTRVHEYGGGAAVVAAGVAYCSNFADQRIYRVAVDASVPPVAVTPEGPWCFADAVVDAARQRLVCVREDHTRAGAEPVTTLVSIALDSAAPDAGLVIAEGFEFYSTPRLSPDGRRLAWICWRHPNMPWDGTELWVADVTAEGGLRLPTRLAGGASESIYQPGWLPDGTLCFASDRDDWWRLFRWTPATGAIAPLLREPPARTEFGRPQWVFGTATWASLGGGRIAATFTRDGRWHLGTIDLAEGTLRELAIGLEPLEWLVASPAHAVLVAASAAAADALVRVDVESAAIEVLRRAASGPPLPPSLVSVAEPIAFPTDGGRMAHAFYYPPRNGDVPAPPDGRPPLIVIGHGGPTTATRPTFDLKVQYWTSRGFAVVDVNYSGSSGYGRGYRQRLNGQWGVIDVADMVHVARVLVADGRADPQRLIIRGGSAGGYTALAALAFHPGVFTAGASYYGICDLEVLARDTHKFEARYLDTLIGPYPAMRETYRARSPIHAVDAFNCALILFQGLEDKVVPPNQSELMATALRRKGLPVAYLTFAGEQHGFRDAATIVRSLEAELAFYAAVFGLAIADAIEPPAIANRPEHGP